jgi:hypothetical protein
MPTTMTRPTMTSRPMATRKTLNTFTWPSAIVSILATAYLPPTDLRNITNRGYGGGGRDTLKCGNRRNLRYLLASTCSLGFLPAETPPYHRVDFLSFEANLVLQPLNRVDCGLRERRRTRDVFKVDDTERILAEMTIRAGHIVFDLNARTAVPWREGHLKYATR